MKYLTEGKKAAALALAQALYAATSSSQERRMTMTEFKLKVGDRVELTDGTIQVVREVTDSHIWLSSETMPSVRSVYSLSVPTLPAIKCFLPTPDDTLEVLLLSDDGDVSIGVVTYVDPQGALKVRQRHEGGLTLTWHYEAGGRLVGGLPNFSIIDEEEALEFLGLNDTFSHAKVGWICTMSYGPDKVILDVDIDGDIWVAGRNAESPFCYPPSGTVRREDRADIVAVKPPQDIVATPTRRVTAQTLVLDMIKAGVSVEDLLYAYYNTGE